MRKSHNSTIILLAASVIILFIAVFILRTTLFSPSRQARLIVNEFYSYEQEANFTDSWELLHPLMKERWNKTTYITDRAHVFMGHFGVETFEYTVEEIEKLDEWKMAKDLPTLKGVYKFNVIQSYKGKYGKFNFSQLVYVVNTEDSWKILWDYN
ncbi:hypothetical protein CWR48_02500 [Oceanobacillus arenosus]|uniref:DUF4829 domain-containing protein n=1 Tax=Oceanobacillus arenosus TaxID=1229153 RepID=A0A3D8PZS6_9BACI|nr:hypothetical protein [Oceanobacillus arenosus]RDW21302.1 hypothetical protein CWR48_02500 [Oceanobacillus arenosus]